MERMEAPANGPAGMVAARRGLTLAMYHSSHTRLWDVAGVDGRRNAAPIQGVHSPGDDPNLPGVWSGAAHSRQAACLDSSGSYCM